MEKYRKRLDPLLSPTRPMDNMKLTWDLPQEDELAVQMLTCRFPPSLCVFLL